MKLRAVGVLYAVDGPGSAIGREMFSCWWMPVTALENWFTAAQKLLNQFIKRPNDFVAMGHRQGTTGAEVVLHIDYYQSAFLRAWHVTVSYLLRHIIQGNATSGRGCVPGS